MNDQQETDGPRGPTVGNLYDRVQRLRQQAEGQKRSFPDNWFPSTPGEEIGGEFLQYAEARQRSGDPATVAHLRTPEGDRSV